MSRYSITSVAVTALILSATASAEPSTPTRAEPSPEEQAQIDIIAKKLCTKEPVVGTRIPVRHRCDTPKELAAYHKQARELYQTYTQRPCMVGVGTGENDHVMSC